jgi:aryl-alcohol dehydrogenase (NADP+)
VLDKIDEIVPPGTDIAPLEGSAYVPPAIARVELRRRAVGERAAA